MRIPERNWTLAAHYDAPADVERQQLQSVAELAGTAPEDVAIIAQVRRPQATPGGFFAKLLHRVPESWTGTRTYDLTAGSTVLEDCPSSEPPTPQQLGQTLADALASQPSRHTAIVLGGHGAGYLGTKGMSVDEVAQALAETTRLQGRKADLLILHSCLMGNLEALRHLAPYAHYAVVSENSQDPGALPLRREGLEGDARTLGASLVQSSGATTQSLVDLSRVEELSQSLERLAPELEKHPEATRQALAQPFPLGRHEDTQAVLGVADLGILLNALGDSPQVAESQALLRETVVANKATHVDSGSAGLSIRTGTQGLEETDYARRSGMPGWAHMLGVLADGLTSTP